MRIGSIIFAAVIILSFVVAPLLSLYGDLLWFNTLGYGSVFWTMVSARLMLGTITASVFFAVVYINLRIAKKTRDKKEKGSLKAFVIISGFFALLIGIAFSGSWEIMLKFYNASMFGITDPVFNADISFYAFVLPFYNMIIDYLIVLLFFTSLFSITAYILHSKLFSVEKVEIEGMPIQGSRVKTNFGKIKLNRKHLSILGGAFFLLLAAKFFMQRYDVLFSARGAVLGAAYTDLNITLPVLLLYSLASVVVAVAFFAHMKWNTKPLMFIGAFVAVLFIGGLAGFVVQAFIVEPDEFNIEKPYIERNIEYTLKAYNLDDVNEMTFPVEYELDSYDLEENSQTIDNIRLWDFRPLLSTYNQLQIFRTYYDFNDIDVDRYYLDGEYKQVMLAARELDQSSLSGEAKTWVNKHLVYTHGYGVAMSPVTMISNEGLPEFYIRDIPPKSDYFEIERPELYYGEETNEFIVVKTTTEEFDYPKGDENIYTTYNGTGGVELDLLKRLVYALKFGSIEILISNSIQPDSRLLFYRNVQERVNEIAPFLYYDDDPYIVVSEGRIYWMLDAYTVTSRYPYSEPIGEEANYIRNSVKVVIDAYNGDVAYYVIEDEPVINTYRKIFPDLFRNFTEMPGDLQQHIRYPEGLFTIQSIIYSNYHMRDPRVFYNKEDPWVTPDEIYRSSRQKMIPYYVIMKLPEKAKEEFILMIPFTPRGKINMIGWMAALSDQPDYGKVVVYLFSKQELIYGPMQIEARIDQDTEISQLITLWSQSGSEVIRGNTLVIPVEDSIIYVEPLYLQASQDAVPELKRVIVAYGNRLTMQESLEDALDVIFKQGIAPEQPPTDGKTTDQLIAEAADHYNKAQEALKAGDWAIYGSEIAKLGEILEKLAE